MARPASAWASSAQAKSNTLEISNGVRQATEDLKRIMPDGVDIRVTSDDATFIRGSIDEVRKTLIIAITIVIAIIFLFLLDWRATLIPAVTLPIALIGTFAAIYLAGFSVNILTLLALVLATGMVVDDAIVVLENIVRKRNEGMGPARRGRARRARGLLRGHHDHRDACRGLYPDFLPAGTSRRPVSRIRLRARIRRDAVQRRRADAVSHARLAPDQGARRE
jgi:Cu/Ag efflux pump CusA